MTWMAQVVNSDFQLFMRQSVALTVWDQYDRIATYPVLDTNGQMALYTHNPDSMADGEKPREPFDWVIHEDAARALMHALMQHFKQAEVKDYDRLREDYEIQRKELAEARRIIDGTLQTILTKRASFTKQEGESTT